MGDTDNMDLALTLTGDATGAHAAVTSTADDFKMLEASLSLITQELGTLNESSMKIEGDLQKMGSAAEQTSGKIRANADAVKQHGQATSEASNLAKDWEQHVRTTSMALDAMGASSGAAVTKVSALGALFTSLGDAVPEVVALGSATALMFAAFETGKNAVGAASTLQDAMIRLGQAVKDQGGNWTMLSGQVKAYANLQATTTNFSDTAVIASLNRLVTSGMSVKDAMVVTRVAEDAAAATGRDLGEVTQGLVEAEKGRTNGLMSLGIATRAQIKDGMDFDTVLALIEQHMGGDAAAAAATYSGSIVGLGTAWTKLLEDAGTPFLGLLADVVHHVTEVVSSIDGDLQPAFKAIAAWAVTAIPAIESNFQQFQQTVSFLGHEFRDVAGPDGADGLHQALDDLGSMINEVEGSLTNGKTGWEGFRDLLKQTAESAKDVRDIFQGIADWLNKDADAQANFARSVNSFWNSDAGQMTALQLKNPMIQLIPGIGPLAAMASASASANIGELPPAPTDLSGKNPRYIWQGPPNLPPPKPPPGKTPTHTDFNPRVGGPQGSGTQPSPFEGADVMPDFKMQSDDLKQLNDALSQLPKNLDGYSAALKMLSPVIEQDEQAQGALQKQLYDARDALAVAASAYNNLNEKMQGMPTNSKEYKEDAAQLKLLKQTYDDAQKSVTQISSAFEKNATDLESLRKEYAANQDAIAKLKTDWTDFVSSSITKTNEEFLTFQMTNQQKVVFYAGIVAAINQTDARSLATRQAAESSYLQSWLAMEKEKYQAEVNFETQASGKVSTFVDSIVTEHQSMAQALHSVYDDILKWFVDMLTQMIIKSQAFAWIMQALGLGGGGNAITNGMNFGMLPPDIGSPGFGTNIAGGGSGGGGGGGGSAMISGAISRAMTPSGGGGSVGSGSYAFGGGAGGGFGGASGSVPDFGGGGGTMPDSAFPGVSAGSSPFGGAGAGGGGGAGGGAAGGGFMAAGYNFGPSALGIAGMLPRGFAGLLGGVGAVGVGGSMLGSLLFGGKGYSALGGAIGGLGMLLGGGLALQGGIMAGAGLGPAMLAMLANPIGLGLIAGAIILSAFGGSLFGDHFNKADEPDIYDPQWGQANADMQGSTAGNPMNANGKQFVMDSQTSAATGGRGWNIMMENFVSKFRGNVKALPSDLQDAFPQIESLWGGATDKQFFNPDGKNGYLDIGSGKRALWSDFWGQVTTHGQSISQLMTSLSPTDIYNVSLSGATRSVGVQTPSGGSSPWSPPGMGNNAMASPGASTAIAAGGAGKLGGLIGQRIANNIQINISQQNSGSLVANQNLERTIQDAVAAALPHAMQDLNTR